MEYLGMALIGGAIAGWGVAVMAFWRSRDGSSDSPETDSEQLSAAYSRGCGDCRCQRVVQ